MSYETLSLSGFINEMEDASTGSHTRKFCFVLGAGASISSGIPSGQKLVDIWDKELMGRNSERHLRWKADKGITDENKYGFYSQYYDRRYEKEPSDGYNFLEKQMEHAKPSVGYVMLAYLLTKTQHNVVITTNFDHLIEDAVNYYSQEIPLVIGHEALAHYIQSKITRPTIIKIHRDLLLDPKSRTEELEELHNNWKEYLPIIFSEYHPVFIGYAGNDKSLMDFLNENSAKFKEGAWKYPYWMLYKKDSLEGNVLEFLKGAEGYVIKHDGFDETLYRIGAKFDYVVPKEEAFLADPKKRYQTLSNAFAKFSEKYSKEVKTSGGDGSSEDGKMSDIGQAISRVTDQSELLRMYITAAELHHAGKYEEALQIKRELVEMSSDNALFWNSLGVTLHKLKCFDEALAATQKAVDLEPDNALYWNSLGVTLHELGCFDEALAAAQKAVEFEPDNARYWVNLGVTLHELGCFDEALAAAQKAVDLEPYNALYWDNLGITLHDLGRFDEALITMQNATDMEPNNALHQFGLFVILDSMGRFDEALVAIQKAVDLEPDDALYWINLGDTLQELGRFDEALDAKQKAVDLEPDDAFYWNSFSITLHKMGRFDEALVAAQKAVDLDPDNARYQRGLGITLRELGRFDEALAIIQKAVDLEPDNANCLNSLGFTLYRMERFDEALIAAQKAVDLASDNASCWDTLGITLHQLGRFDEALAAEQKAVDLEPNNAVYWDSLSITLRKMGRIDEALAAEQKARDLRK